MRKKNLFDDYAKSNPPNGIRIKSYFMTKKMKQNKTQKKNQQPKENYAIFRCVHFSIDAILLFFSIFENEIKKLSNKI